MAFCKRIKRKGISRVGLLIVVLIALVLLGLLIPFSYQVNVGGNGRVACTSKLREIGLACKNYESGHGYLPMENQKAKTSFLWAIREEIEIVIPKGDETPPVPQFLCPSRRNARAVNGPYSDYGYGDHPSKFGGEGHSVLAGSDKVSTEMIKEGGGTTNTLWVSHLGLKPKDYVPGGGPGDVHWKTGPLKRNPMKLIHDSDDQSMTDFLGAPHSLGSPCLFVDGSVRRLGYDIPAPILGALWSYDVKKSIPDEYQGK